MMLATTRTWMLMRGGTSHTSTTTTTEMMVRRSVGSGAANLTTWGRQTTTKRVVGVEGRVNYGLSPLFPNNNMSYQTMNSQTFPPSTTRRRWLSFFNVNIGTTTPNQPPPPPIASPNPTTTTPLETPTKRKLSDLPRAERSKYKKGSAARRNFLYPDVPRITGGFYPVRGPVLHEKEKRLKEIEWRGPYIPVSPKKFNDVAQMIRGFTAVEAQAQLRYSPKAVATATMLVLQRAVAEAESKLHLSADQVIVGQAFVGTKIVGSVIDIKGRGRQGRITKRESRLTIRLYQHPALVPGFQSTKLVFRSTTAPTNRRQSLFTTKANVRKV